MLLNTHKISRGLVGRIKMPAFSFRPQAEDNNERRNDQALEKRERQWVSQTFLQSILNGHRRRSQQDSQLVDETGKQAAHRVRREFIQMGRNNSKRALHAG